MLENQLERDDAGFDGMIQEKEKDRKADSSVDAGPETGRDDDGQHHYR